MKLKINLIYNHECLAIIDDVLMHSKHDAKD